MSDSKKGCRCPIIVQAGNWVVNLASGVMTAVVRGTYGGSQGLLFNVGDALAYGFYVLPGFFRYRRRSTLAIKFFSIIPLRANDIDTGEIKGRFGLITKEFGEGEATVTLSTRRSRADVQTVHIRNSLTFPSECSA